MTTREEMETTLVYDHIEKVWRFCRFGLYVKRVFQAVSVGGATRRCTGADAKDSRHSGWGR